MNPVTDGQVHVSVEQVDGAGIATVVMDRADKFNSLTKHMCLELVRVFGELDMAPEVQVIVFRGAGGNFCAGANIENFEEVIFDGRGDPGAPAHGIDWLSEVDAALTRVRKPTVAVIEGICMGGGWQLAAAADVVLASTTARIALTPAKLGIIYPRPGLERLVERVGPDRAKYILFTASEVEPHLAEQWGMVTRTIDAGSIEEEVAALTRSMTKKSQFSLAAAKALIDAAPNHADSAWESWWTGMIDGEDFAAGRAAFMAKERPAFTWRHQDQ